MDKVEKTKGAQLLFGWLAAFFISTGTFFKLMHWPSASQQLIIGNICFVLFYLPLWLLNLKKENRNWRTYFQFLALLLTAVTFLFKTQYWPGAGILFNLWISLSLYIIFPLALYQLFRNGGKSQAFLHQLIIYFLLGSLIIGGIGGGVQRGDFIARSFAKNTLQVKNSISRLELRNKQLYNVFDEISRKDTLFFYTRALRLKQLTDSVEQYLKSFRNALISNVEEVNLSKADTMDIADMKSISNIKSPTNFICGLDYFEPKKGKYSGTELKQLIELFRDSIPEFMNGENKNLIKNGMNLDTEPGYNENGDQIDWVFATFRDQNLSSVLLTLENIKYEVKNAETQVLTELVNSYKSNSNNLALKVAELGTKLETEKKQREIEQLKSERELNALSITAKNIEIESQNHIIILFVSGLLLCGVLIFFTIRSNLLRKKIYLELQEQKREIEEKQKEILDSINYAQRIQRSHLPTDKYINNKINKLKDSSFES
ncbi:MAG: hypothetical protein IPM51_14975 [Sphingobacteriaceae bacterium]|nr:hypothetical protein [Sphingobacteriaceae bacterium]